MLLALLLAQAAAPSSADDVVVIGERLKHWGGKVESTAFSTRCRTTRSTGDAEIDKVGCAAMMACWPAAKPSLLAARDRHRDAAERERLQAETQRTFKDCALPKRDVLIAELIDRRHAAQDAKR